MADHNFSQYLKAVGGTTEIVYCQFTTAGTSAPTGFSSQGVVSVARTGVGTFELTFPRSWKNIHPVFATGGAAAAQLGRPTLRSATASTKKCVVATVESDAAPVDIETTGVTIYCTFMLRQA
ncbi:MAG TPA: hypothetical protein VEL28_01635 [Candidatus Binatia bacterium]|nr:hypothetical protein [Candidatus Binatia bacterium]